MAKFVYPAIFYYDSEYSNYNVAMPDVNIYAEGDTIEEAYKNAQDFLLSYLDCCQQLEQEPEKPSDYNDVVLSHKKNIVMLVSVEVPDKPSKQKNTTAPQASNDILEDFNNILDNNFDDFSLPPID